MNKTEKQIIHKKKISKAIKIAALLALLFTLVFGIWYFLYNRDTLDTYNNNTEAIIPDIQASERINLTWEGNAPQQTSRPSVNTAKNPQAPKGLDMLSFANTDNNHTNTIIPDTNPANKNSPYGDTSASKQSGKISINTAETPTIPLKFTTTKKQKESILFLFDSTELREGQMSKLEKFIQTIPPDYNAILIEGYTCDIGEEDYNNKLSLNRANTISDILKQKGYQNLKVISYGESAYSDKQNSPRYLYRKVDISLN